MNDPSKTLKELNEQILSKAGERTFFDKYAAKIVAEVDCNIDDARWLRQMCEDGTFARQWIDFHAAALLITGKDKKEVEEQVKSLLLLSSIFYKDIKKKLGDDEYRIKEDYE